MNSLAKPMGTLSRSVFREVAYSALLGTSLFTFVLFLQKLSRLFEIFVRSSAPPAQVAYLFGLVLPPTLTFAIPVGVLVGVLLVTNRLSGDGEVIALRAAGVPSQRLLYPVVAFALMAVTVTAAATLWLTPLSIRETYRVLNRLLAEQITAEIQPRVFEESFPNTILYVGDVVPGPVVRWRQVFIADLSPPGERAGRANASSDHPRITIAREAVAIPDTSNNRIQLSMIGGRSHTVGEDQSDYDSFAFPKGEQVLQAKVPRQEQARPFTWMDTRPLMAEAAESAEARIELHQRFALPLACLVLALIAVPLGISTRKGGKSSAFVLTVVIAFFYYMGLISLIGMAKQGNLPVMVAVWTPNVVLAALSVILLVRLETPGDRDIAGAIRSRLVGLFRSLRWRVPAGPVAGRRTTSTPLLPQIIDTYVLSSFLFYFVVLLASFVALTHIFTFFELLGDIVKNGIPMSRVVTYHVFLTPKLIYDAAPVSVLVAVLMTFGVLSKNNEVTAMKASGISLYRMSVPVLMSSLALSASLFAFDHYYVPEANRIQDGIRSEIKGRPVQTYLRPNQTWIRGEESRIYHYRYFDQSADVMYGVTVLDLDPETFELTRHVYAERARWEASLGAWVFQDGWRRVLEGVHVTAYDDFTGEARTFPGLDEPPGYFLKEVKKDQQMNYAELQNYIHDLQQSGFDTIRLQVQFHRKFSVPLFALIFALISVPFAFVAGPRGGMAGVGVSFSVAIAYWAVNQLFLQVGNLNQLPPVMAAWSPDLIFTLVGMYLFTHMRT